MTAYPPFPSRRPSSLPLVVAGAAFALATFVVLDRAGVFTPPPSAEPRAVTPRGDLAALEQTFVDVFARCSPSVAHINTSSLVRTGWGRVAEQRGSGSGFVWDRAGTVVTNHHVVENAREVQVSVGGRNFRADVLASSPAHDLAVLRLRGDVADLAPLAVGSSADLKVGQTAIAIGNPFGFDQTMTTGIVSALDRSLEKPDGGLMHGLVQVDAAINPGNSGGPLLDSAGRLVGVTTAIYSPNGANAGIGFAVPVDLVNEIVPRLLGGKSTTAILGVKTQYSSYRLDGDLGYSSGAIVTEVVDGYGAAAAGLRPFRIAAAARGEAIEQYGDVLVAIDGKPLRTFDELPRLLAGRKPGDTVKVTVVRGLPEQPQAVELPIRLTAPGESVRSGS
jgi:S1-C subfamily serine protease